MAYKISNNLEYITYQVQDGDTYQSIASENGISLSELVVLNDLESSDLKRILVGSVLRVGVRDKYTGQIEETEITTDDSIESTLKSAAMQTISVDSVTEKTLGEIKAKYYVTGNIDSIKNDVRYLSDLGYTRDEVDVLLNDSSIYLTDKQKDEIYSDDLEKADKDSAWGNLKNAVDGGSKNSYDDSDISKDTIFGLPFRYNTYSDPRRRVYNSTFMTDAAILSIIPGIPAFRGAKDDNDETGFLAEVRNLFDSSDDKGILSSTKSKLLNEETDEAILNWLKKSQKDNMVNGDLRYYRFQDDYIKFLEYLDINVSTLAVKMGVGSLGSARYKDFMKNMDPNSLFNISHAFKFYCTKSGSSTSESISNEFGESQLAGTMNGISDTANELRYLLGEAADGVGANFSKLSDKLTGSVGELIGSLFEGAEGSVKQVGSAISAAADGAKLIWPNIWKNSNFQRSYNFSFEFVSPYGNPEAIFRYVYLPFLTLLTLASPKQDGVAGYKTPFLVRLDMPGFCTSDLSVIQNMSWKKGGNDGLFTNDGLPLAITVDITVQDLYPNIAISGGWSELRHNTGMHGFLDNMAGLAVQRFSPFENIKNALTIRAVNVIGNFTRTINEGFKSKIYAISTSSDIFGSAYNS